jgi:hypothetical protein
LREPTEDLKRALPAIAGEVQYYFGELAAIARDVLEIARGE